MSSNGINVEGMTKLIQRFSANIFAVAFSLECWYDKHNPYDAMADSEINIISAVMVFGMYAMFMGTIGFLGYSRMSVSDDMNLNVNQ